jgi:hypothetical protein
VAEGCENDKERKVGLWRDGVRLRVKKFKIRGRGMGTKKRGERRETRGADSRELGWNRKRKCEGRFEEVKFKRTGVGNRVISALIFCFALPIQCSI